MENVLLIAYFLIAIAVSLGFVLAFLIFPRQLLRFLGRITKYFLKDFGGLDDKSIDSLPFLPGLHLYMGRSRLSQYVRDLQGESNDFKWQIWFFRLIGLVILCALVLTLSLMALGYYRRILGY